MTAHIEPIFTPRPLGSDLTLAIISVGLIFIAKPLVAQTFGAETATQSMQTGAAVNTQLSPGTYVNPLLNATPDRVPATSSSQSQRSANSEQNGSTSQVQPLPECRIDDTACIEAKNNKNTLTPQTAPTIIR